MPITDTPPMHDSEPGVWSIRYHTDDILISHDPLWAAWACLYERQRVAMLAEIEPHSSP